MSDASRRAVRIFFCYSHKDEALRDALETHLASLKREGLVETWHDRKIAPGEPWAGKISEHLERADVVLLLVSADFLASDYCYDVEMDRALARHEAVLARSSADELLRRVAELTFDPFDWNLIRFSSSHADSHADSHAWPRRRSAACGGRLP